MSNLQKRLSTLSPEKLALILKKLNKNKQDRPAQKSRSAMARVRERQILPVARTEPIPLSFAQQRLWFLDQLDGRRDTYNMPGALRLDGRLNLMAFRKSLNEIVRRHEILRSTFSMLNGTAVQQIAPYAPIELPIVDLSAWGKAEREAEAQRLAMEEREGAFDLLNGPLFRVKLLRLAPTSHIFLLNMHHIVSDGWSIGVVIQELSLLYEAYSKGKRSPLPDLPIQYADFAHWQRRWFSGTRLNTQLAYWSKQLADAPPLLQLPTDRPRPSVQSFEGAESGFVLPKALANGVKALSRKRGATLFMTLQAAFATLLYRYSAEQDVLVGTPIANRNRAEIEPLIGFFVNILVLRTSFQNNPTFDELLKQVQAMALDAYKHQELPFEVLVESLRPERTLSHNPLFQVVFALENVPSEELSLGGLKVTFLDVDNLTAKFDLSLLMIENEQGLSGSWEYNSDLFDLETIQRMAGHFERLLTAIVANPAQRVADLPFLTAGERRQLLVEWNATPRDYPRESSIHELFEEQVERTPNAMAVVYPEARGANGVETMQLTYRELNERANQVANTLIELGVRADDLVGICMERSVEMMVGLLGILKAGGAYVPLDPSYPKERLQFMLEDTQVSVLLTQEQFVERLPATEKSKRLTLDADWEMIAQASSKNPISHVTGDHLAYVIYTSGSTGKPKGVQINHRAVNRLVINTDYIQLSATDRVAQASNSSFDAATFEIWGAFLNGATLVGVSRDVMLSPSRFAAFLREEKINTLFLTTALFNQVASEVPDAFSPLKYVLFGGEAVDPKWVKVVKERGSPTHLLHVYGPTENTTFSSWHLVKDVPQGATTVPIGRPIANTQIYLLDEQLHPVPVGVPGELLLGGDGLARGYLNRPTLTNERFIANPFGAGRLYKTGDLCRYLPDGSIEFMGRFDHQVKIRGFRIELGEIEAAISEHPEVREVIVLAREDDPGNKRLVAYMVPEEGLVTVSASPHPPAASASPNTRRGGAKRVPPLALGGVRGGLVANQQAAQSVVRQYLSQRLPDYMVPDLFMILDMLPLTPNGKVDRKALPVPDRSSLSITFVAPRTPTERRLATIWADVLAVAKIGIHDDFFELGGHSLLATQLASRVREAFQIALPIRHLFELATVAELAELIDTLQEEPMSRDQENEDDEEEEEEGEI